MRRKQRFRESSPVKDLNKKGESRRDEAKKENIQAKKGRGVQTKREVTSNVTKHV